MRFENLGLCYVCGREAVIDALDERLGELQAKRDANRLSKRIQRLNDDLNPDRPRRSGGHTEKKTRGE